MKKATKKHSFNLWARIFRRNQKYYKRVIGDYTYEKLSLIFAVMIIFLLFFVVIEILIESMPAFKQFGFGFIASSSWDSSKEQFGALPSIYGSVVGALLSMIFAIPISIGIAVYLSQIANKKLKAIVGVAIELLAAIPSIVYGMVGLLFLVPLISASTGYASVGMGILAASIVLSIMALPFMAALMRDSLQTTPDVLQESAYALGATKFEVIKDVVFPYAKIGVVGSIILALSRVLGETMAVTFLLGGAQKISSSLVDPATNIPSTIAINFGESTGLYTSSLFYLSLILMVINFIVIFIAKYFINKK